MICDPALEDVTTDAIETRLVELESVVARARAAQVRLLREVDVRQVPLSDGCRNLVEWTGSRLDLAPETATAMVKLAHTDSESVDRAAADGIITFDRAVELTRLDVADPVAEGAGYSIPRLRHHIACRRPFTRSEERDRYADRYLMMQPSLDQTALRLQGELVGIDATRFEQVLTEAADQIPSLPGGRREPRKARLADALVNIVIDAAVDDPASPGSTVVSVLVDANTATATNGGAGVRTLSGLRIGPAALEAILCDGIVEVNAITADGTVLGVGDRSHTIAPRIRRFIHHRDGMCTADGCTSRYRLQPHHIRHRVDGGLNDPTNLTLLCWFHHHVVIHRHGHRIDPDSRPGRIRFLPPEPGVDPPI